ncbi:MAG: hypothetical protein IJO88_07540 [Oscillospiraceae bacterium]|nr:hypothetical protein [Oscillospiraceae bacterium]
MEEKMLIAWAIIGIAALVMLIKWPTSLIGYLYCIVVGYFVSDWFLGSLIESHSDFMQIATLGCGVGAIFGLVFAIIIHRIKDLEADIGVILFCMVLTPILMIVLGFIAIGAILVIWMLETGKVFELTAAGVVTWGLVSSLIGGGGSIVVILMDS